MKLASVAWLAMLLLGAGLATALSGCDRMNFVPQPSFVASPSSGPAPLTVSFDASASTDDREIVSYTWSFGDNESGSGVSLSHTYYVPGTYTATLTVVDDQHASNSVSHTVIAGVALVAWYTFDEAIMTTLPDHSQYTNNGDIQQIEGVVPGKAENAFSFDGINDWVQVPDSESLQGIRHLEVSCWVKPRSYPPDRIQDWTGIVAYGAESQGMWEIFITHEGAIHFLLNYRTPAETRVTSSKHLGLDTWHHVVCTFDGTAARVYIDDQLSGEAACSGLLYPGAGSYMAIGLDFPDGDEYFHGLIDDLRIYNEADVP